MKPILFNTDMVKAILDGRKTVTRRIIKPQPGVDEELFYIYAAGRKSDIGKWQSRIAGRKWTPPYHAEDILYVRETWRIRNVFGDWNRCDRSAEIEFLAGGTSITLHNITRRFEDWRKGTRWLPSIHMPRTAARIFLRVDCVRVERLQDITADECPMEGVWPLAACTVGERDTYYRSKFAELWDSTIKPADLDKYGWAANPWVWVIKFERCKRPEVDGL